MILLEGTECVGKTTTAMTLRRAMHGWSYRHFTVPPKCINAYRYHTWPFPDAQPRVIVDRLHWSEYAYGPQYRNEVGYTTEEWRKLELLLLSRGCTVLHLTDDPEAIKRRWRASAKSQHYSVEIADSVYERYSQLAARSSKPFVSHLPIVTARLTDLIKDGEITPLLKAFMRDAEETARQCTQLLPASVGCGAHSPEFVILGEEPRDQCKVGGDEPQVPLSAGPACDWLWQTLEELAVPWWKGYYTNVSAFASPYKLAEYLNVVLQPRLVMALGRKAKYALEIAQRDCALRSEIIVTDVYHPGYVKRFYYGTYEQWRDTVAEALSPLNWSNPTQTSVETIKQLIKATRS